MSLLEELKEKLQTVCAEQDEQLAKIRVHEAFLGAAMQDIRDLSRAIAALEPSAVEGSSVAAYFDARRAEALLDPQPEAASPEFASEQGEAIEHMIATSDAVCEELSEAYTPPQIPEGFTPWSGGECPVSKDQVVELLFRESWAGDGSGRAIYISDPADYADLTQWKHHGQGGDIIAYRIIQPSAEAERIEDERDETWVPPPGYTYIPTQGERCVCVNLMQDGIGNFFCCNQRGETSADAERTSDESQAETAIEQTLITDDIPSIPREEIPIGAAVETYTDSGIETVKISGTTYVVDDEPVAEASYAPINSEPASDALMWANGFEADVKAKAEPEQDKRPFWMFAKKEPA